MVASITKASRKPLVSKDDSALKHRLVHFLHLRHVPGADAVEFDVHGGNVVVSGTLATGHAKWLCLGCCRNVAGVIKLVDEVVVESSW